MMFMRMMRIGSFGKEREMTKPKTVFNERMRELARRAESKGRDL